MANIVVYKIKCGQTNDPNSDNMGIIIAADHPGVILYNVHSVFVTGSELDINKTFNFNTEFRVNLIRNLPGGGYVAFTPRKIPANQSPDLPGQAQLYGIFPEHGPAPGEYDVIMSVLGAQSGGSTGQPQSTQPQGNMTFSQQNSPGIPATFATNPFSGQQVQITPAQAGVPISWTVELDHQAVQGLTGGDMQNNIDELAGAAGAPAGVSDVLIAFIVAIKAADATNSNGARIIYTYLTNSTLVLPR